MRNISIFLFTLSLAVSYGLAFSEPIYIEGEKGRFRAGPGTNYQVLWESPKYTPVEYLAKYKDWYVARHRDGDVGWVHKQVVGKGKAAVVIKKKANIRKGPGMKNAIAFSVEQDYLFKVVEKKGDWFKVSDVDGDTGWVAESLVWISK